MYSKIYGEGNQLEESCTKLQSNSTVSLVALLGTNPSSLIRTGALYDVDVL